MSFSNEALKGGMCVWHKVDHSLLSHRVDTSHSVKSTRGVSTLLNLVRLPYILGTRVTGIDVNNLLAWTIVISAIMS